jgi:hypothetical protein
VQPLSFECGFHLRRTLFFWEIFFHKGNMLGTLVIMRDGLSFVNVQFQWSTEPNYLF